MNTPLPTTCRVRPDILADAIPPHSGYYSRVAPRRRIATALKFLTLETASLGDMPGGCAGEDGLHVESDAVKRRVRLYLESWVIPQLEQAYDQLNKK